MESRSRRSLSVPVISTVAFTICFAVWMMFAVIGFRPKASPLLR